MNNLRTIRIKRNMSQEELADLTGLTEATINRLETGRCKLPHFITRKRLARILKVAVEELGFNYNEGG